MIPFNKPCVIGKESQAIQEAMTQSKLSGNGPFGQKCTNWLEKHLDCEKALLTPSCTAALEMTALLTEVSEGDEVIMPSYTFVSTANAFALRGASIRFVDVEPSTMNINPVKIEEAITEHTKAIVIVHYAGIACDMHAIMDIAYRHHLWVIEDAAQALLSTYKEEPLGTIGHFGTISFHETKNITCGEGGALIINEESAVERAEILQEKGTNREQFIKGMVDKYTWRDIGSSYLLSDLNAAYLHVQLEHAETINHERKLIWEYYDYELQPLFDSRELSGPTVPDSCEHNGHLYYLKTSCEEERSHLIEFLNDQGIMAVSHYVPLHSAHAGKRNGSFSGVDQYTTTESQKLVRLPLYYGIEKEDVDHVVNCLHQFY
ncbi:dTDP-4-amino-4,6-dideoxygalactose transaminase [Virgibacillus byunsanensis]|uniref:dTDP-4-amino-4,6-dideoxygalactose transaminase n=1 Tax=Virgibacillus byunsanensis TaxID=570945 RepID=A0ABW3LJA4_9BACI